MAFITSGGSGSSSSEVIQDAIGTILTDTASVNFTYNDAGNIITADVLPAGVDHNSLANLSAGEPHPQYVLIDGDVMTGSLVMDNQVGIAFRELTSNGTDSITIQAPASLAGGYILTLPPDDGTASQVLTTNGAGVLSWSTPGAGYTDEEAQDATGTILTDSASVDFTYNDGANTITAVVLPAGVDHGGLGGLADNDHPQYVLKGTAATNQVSYWTDANTIAGDSGLIWNSASNLLGINCVPASANLEVQSTGNLARLIYDSSNYQQMSIDSGGSLTFVGNSNVNSGGSFSASAASSSAGIPGQISLTSGSRTGGIGNGGSMALTSGAGFGAGGDGGQVNLGCGAAGDIGTGGSLYILSGDGGATSGNSGGIVISSGAVVSGTKGTIQLQNDGGHVTLGGGTSASELKFLEPSGSGVSSVSIKAPALATSYTLTLPVDDGTSNQVLKTDGSGVLSWTTPASGTVTGSGSATQVAFWDSSSSLSGENELYWDSTNNRLGIGSNGPTVPLDVQSTSAPQCRISYDTNSYFEVSVSNVGAASLRNSSINSGGSAFNIDADPGSSNGNGGALNLTSGAGAGSGQGGQLNLKSAVGGATGAGGTLTIQSGDGGATSGDSGYVYLKSGAFTSGNKGPVYLQDNGGNVILGGSTTACELRFMEPSGSGTNYAAIKCPAIAANYTLTLPVDDGTSGQALTTDGSGVLSWASAGGASAAGTSGQVAFFNGASSLISETSGFAWDSTNNRLGIGLDAPDVPLQVLSTTEQMRVSYNATNYIKTTVGSTSNTTFETVSSSGTGGNITIRGNSGTVPGVITLEPGSATSGNNTGGNLSLGSGSGSGTASGGAVSISAGTGGGTDGAGGAITITGGSGGATNGIGGAVTVQAGAGTGTGGGQVLTLSGGTAGTSAGATGGGIQFTSKNGTTTGTGGSGGNFLFTGGNAGGSGNNNGAYFHVNCGNATGTTAGGAIQLTSGTGGATGIGGAASLAAGTGGATSGAGGDLTLKAGASQSGSSGGVINLQTATTTSLTTRLSIAANGVVSTASGRKIARLAKSDADYTVLVTDHYVGLTAITAARTWTLPAASSAGAGAQLIFKDESGSITGALTLTIDGNASETIDGATTYVMTTAYESITLICDGSNWFII